MNIFLFVNEFWKGEHQNFWTIFETFKTRTFFENSLTFLETWIYLNLEFVSKIRTYFETPEHFLKLLKKIETRFVFEIPEHVLKYEHFLRVNKLSFFENMNKFENENFFEIPYLVRNMNIFRKIHCL